MYLLSVTDIKKSFGPVKALKGVTLGVKKGEVHAVIGENGAGKSTLMKILSGAESPDEGKIEFNGVLYKPSSPAEGRNAGIAMIYQELTLAPHMSVEENISLGIEKSNKGIKIDQSKRVKEILEGLGQSEIKPSQMVGKLSIGKQQMVEIARAVFAESQLVIMDEPTSSLSADDTRALFNVIQRLKERGISVIYISHFLEEVQEISDRFTVIRDGESVGEGNMKEVTIPEVIQKMVGRSLDEMYPSIPHDIGEVVLEVKSLKGIPYPKNVSFKLRRGEIMGISGLVGAGRSETIRSLFGMEKVENGKVVIKSQPELNAEYFNPNQALKAGFDLLSENRKEEGLALNLPIFMNITLSGLKRFTRMGIVNLKNEFDAAQKLSTEVAVKCRDIRQAVAALSGGNQQKVSIARLLNHNSDIFFLDEPTRGIDVGSKAEIYRIIQNLAAKGKSIIVISSYLPELLGICDTLAVMHKGTMSEVKKIQDWTTHDIMLYATAGERVKS